MTHQQLEVLQLDIKRSILISLFSCAIIIPGQQTEQVFENIDTINTAELSAFAISLTIISLIFTFEGVFKENSAIKELKAANQIGSIQYIYIISCGVAGVAWLITLMINIFQFPFSTPIWMDWIVLYILVLLFVLTIVRMWRSFYAFILLNKAVRVREKEE